MNLISSTTIAPIPHEPDRGDDAIALFPNVPENITDLIRGVAGCSAYLRGLITGEATWLSGALEAPAEDILPGIQAEVLAEGPDRAAKALRKAKRRIALYAALADTGGMWDLNEVTGLLTDFADFAVQTALNALVAAEFERGKLPGCEIEDLKTACGIVVLAMGKMGAGELNYSSDIDLVVLFDESRLKDEHFDDIRERFIRITRRMAKMLSDVTSEGYVFRTDLRLRPDPSVTPVCLSMGAAERYYESLGRTWERAAFIKARPCAGDIKAGWAFLETLRPFVWRKHLDYAAIQDAHDMRLRIREHKGLGGPITLPGHNMKLGRGGIREIEFFTQTRQIIAGGRDPDLRNRETLKSLVVLAEKGWIEPEVAVALSDAYVEHRKVEHRIQMLADAQTHDIPSSPEQVARLAHFCGFPDVSSFRADVVTRLEMVHNLTESFFAPEEGSNTDLSSFDDAMREMVEKWYALPVLRGARAKEIFKRLLPAILERVAAMKNPNETLIQFDGFLAGLPAGVQLFSLFEANPHLIDLLTDICGSAPGLARYLSRNAQVFDGVIGGTFFEPLPGVSELTAAIEYLLGGIEDYENQLNAARRWMKEHHFRIGVQHLKGMIPSEQAAQNYSDLAESCLRGILPAVIAEFSRRHGPMPGRGVAVLGMGSLGARSLTSTSDLDLIVIYDALGQEASEGKRPLAVSTYFARMTQALVTALTSPMSDGRLYEVDMRLRPSGRKGPVATPLTGFLNYQQNEAWTWEHLALTRARLVAGNDPLCHKIEDIRQAVIAKERDTAQAISDVGDMRRRLADAADRARVAGAWETKLGPGRMLDIELLAQAAALISGSPVRAVDDQLELGAELGWYDPTQLSEIKAAYSRLRRIQQIGRLVVEGQPNPESMGQGGRDLMLSETDEASLESLKARLTEAQTMVDVLVSGVFGRAQT